MSDSDRHSSGDDRSFVLGKYEQVIPLTYTQEYYSKFLAEGSQQIAGLTLISTSIAELCKLSEIPLVRSVGVVLEMGSYMGLISTAAMEIGSLSFIGWGFVAHKIQIPEARTNSILKKFWRLSRQDLVLRSIAYASTVAFAFDFLDHLKR